jgi:hypothetical protein
MEPAAGSARREAVPGEGGATRQQPPQRVPTGRGWRCGAAARLCTPSAGLLRRGSDGAAQREAAPLPLLRLLRAADALDAPRAVAAAAARARARARAPPRPEGDDDAEHTSMRARARACSEARTHALASHAAAQRARAVRDQRIN